MPKALEDQLIRTAKARGWTTKKKGKSILTERGRAYVYGGLRATGWKPSREK